MTPRLLLAVEHGELTWDDAWDLAAEADRDRWLWAYAPEETEDDFNEAPSLALKEAA